MKGKNLGPDGFPAVTCPRCPRPLTLGRVLADVDLSLAAWLSAVLPPRTEIDFGPPARHATERAGRHPVVNVFLYSVDEDTTGLPAGEIRLRDGAGRLAGVLLPARRYAVTYLLTAWAGDPLTEHRLLGDVLVAHAGQDQLGREHLRGVLAEADVNMPVYLGRDGRAANWDGTTLPSHSGLSLIVLAPAVPPLAQITAPPAEQLELVARTRPGTQDPGAQDPGTPRPEVPQPERRWRRTTRSEP